MVEELQSVSQNPIPNTPLKDRNDWITFIGILQILYGVFLLGSSSLNLFLIQFDSSYTSSTSNEFFMAYQSPLVFVCGALSAICWLVLGIGVVQLKPWARKMVLYVSAGWILYSLFFTIFSIPFYKELAVLLKNQDSWFVWIGILGFIMGLTMQFISQVLFPAFFIWFFKLVSVKHTFLHGKVIPTSSAMPLSYLCVAILFFLPQIYMSINMNSVGEFSKYEKMFQDFSGKYGSFLEGYSSSGSSRSSIQWQEQMALDFSLSYVAQGDGETFRLADHIGQKTIILNFFATWCGPCKAEIPELNQFYLKNKDDNQVLLLGIDMGEKKPKVDKFIRKQKVKFPVLLDSDSKVGNRYGVRSYPTTVVIGTDGIIKAYRSGMIRDAEKTFGEIIAASLKVLKNKKSIARETFLEKKTFSHKLSAGSSLTGRAKLIADKMDCPCGCDHDVLACECETAEKIRKDLKSRNFSDQKDEDIIFRLHQKYNDPKPKILDPSKPTSAQEV